MRISSRLCETQCIELDETNFDQRDVIQSQQDKFIEEFHQEKLDQFSQQIAVNPKIGYANLLKAQEPIGTIELSGPSPTQLSEAEKEMPGFWTLWRKLKQEAWLILKFWRTSNRVKCSSAQAESRLRLCLKCDKWNESKQACGICGCRMKVSDLTKGIGKNEFSALTCPHPDGDRWRHVDEAYLTQDQLKQRDELYKR